MRKINGHNIKWCEKLGRNSDQLCRHGYNTLWVSTCGLLDGATYHTDILIHTTLEILCQQSKNMVIL